MRPPSGRAAITVVAGCRRRPLAQLPALRREWRSYGPVGPETRSPRCGLIKFGISLTRSLERFDEELRSRELIFVRRILQQFRSLLRWRPALLPGCGAKPKWRKVSFSSNSRRSKNANCVSMRWPRTTWASSCARMRRQAGFVGQHVNQAAAHDDGVADGKRFERRGHQHAAADFGFDVQIVGDFQIVDHRREHFVDFALRRQQPKPLHAVDDVVFGLAVPGALRLQRREVVRGRRSDPSPAWRLRPESCSVPVPAWRGRGCNPTGASGP